MGANPNSPSPFAGSIARATAYFAGGPVPAERTPDDEVFFARVRDWDARKAEAILAAGGVSPLERFRTQLMRGRLADAAATLAELARGVEDLSDSDQAELLLERARLEAAEGRWID